LEEANSDIKEADCRDKKISQKYCIINAFDTLGQILVNEFAFIFLL